MHDFDDKDGKSWKMTGFFQSNDNPSCVENAEGGNEAINDSDIFFFGPLPSLFLTSYFTFHSETISFLPRNVVSIL